MFKTHQKIVAMFIGVVFLIACTKKITYLAPQEIASLKEGQKIFITMKDGLEWEVRLQGMEKHMMLVKTKDDSLEQFDLNLIESVRIEEGDSAILTVYGIAALVTAGLIIGALTAPEPQGCCPFIYSYDGSGFALDAEPFGAAISEGLKRAEWCTLEHLEEAGGEYRLLIRNEMDETQFTDEITLYAIDHPPGTQIIPDIAGSFYTISNPMPPLAAYSQYSPDLLSKTIRKDGQFWKSSESEGMDESKQSLRDELVFVFPKPEKAQNAKLIINANTSLWGAHMGKEYLKLYGNEIEDWYSEVDRKGPAYYKTLSWYYQEELYMLKLRVETDLGWKVKGAVHSAGPMSPENKVYLLDLEDVSGDTLIIKFTPPRNFWQIDWVAVDYSDCLSLSSKELKAQTALTNQGEDIRNSLSMTDNQYYTMPNIGDVAELVFHAPPQQPGTTRSFILKACGYYHLHLDSGLGQPQWSLIERLRSEPDFALKYSQIKRSEWEQKHAHKTP